MPVFINVTDINGFAHYVNMFWINFLTTDEYEGISITKLYFQDDDKPLWIKESIPDILSKLDEAIAKQKERVDILRAKMIDERS